MSTLLRSEPLRPVAGGCSRADTPLLDQFCESISVIDEQEMCHQKQDEEDCPYDDGKNGQSLDISEREDEAWDVNLPNDSLAMQRGSILPGRDINSINHNRSAAFCMSPDPVVPSRWDKDSFGRCGLSERYRINPR